MLVTGYIRLDRASRPHDVYASLGAQLLAAGVPTMAFLDSGWGYAYLGRGVSVSPASLDSCWMLNLCRSQRLPSVRDDEKDTPEFLAVQCQKTWWLDRAAETTRENLAWVDYGVLHVPGITVDDVRLWAARAAAAPRDKIIVPSIWGPPKSPPPHDAPSWHFAGGALIVPSHLARWFHVAVVIEAAALAQEQGAVTWEVNLWAAVAAKHPYLFSWYPCDHDRSMFANGP